MHEFDDCLRKVNDLLDQAVRTVDMADRSRLIAEALHWQAKAEAANVASDASDPD